MTRRFFLCFPTSIVAIAVAMLPLTGWAACPDFAAPVNYDSGRHCATPSRSSGVKIV